MARKHRKLKASSHDTSTPSPTNLDVTPMRTNPSDARSETERQAEADMLAPDHRWYGTTYNPPPPYCASDEPLDGPEKNPRITVPSLEIRQETKPTGTRVGGGAVLPKYDEDGKLLSYGHGTE